MKTRNYIDSRVLNPISERVPEKLHAIRNTERAETAKSRAVVNLHIAGVVHKIEFTQMGQIVLLPLRCTQSVHGKVHDERVAYSSNKGRK